MVCAKIAMSAPAGLAAMTVGVAMGIMSKLPLINAFEPIPEPMTVMTSASSPYFSKSLPSLVTKMMMLPMPTDGTPTRIFLSGLLCAWPAPVIAKRKITGATAKANLKRRMELSRIKQLEHLEPLERLEPSSHPLRTRINQCSPSFHFDDLDAAHT